MGPGLLGGGGVTGSKSANGWIRLRLQIVLHCIVHFVLTAERVKFLRVYRMTEECLINYL